jgi:hypothetical protein
MKLRAALLALVFALCPLAAQAQSAPVVYQSFSLSAVGPGPTLVLTGQSTCSVVITGGSGFTIVPQAASDGPLYPQTWQTVPAIGAGSITAPGSYTGNVGATGLTNFRINVTTAGAGAITGVESCSLAQVAASAFNATPPNSVNPCGNNLPTSVAINIATATTTQLVAASGSTRVYVCGYEMVANGATNVTLEYGTGTTCGTGTTALTGAIPLAAQTGEVAGFSGNIVTLTPGSQALCILTSAAVQLSGHLTYVQL